MVQSMCDDYLQYLIALKKKTLQKFKSIETGIHLSSVGYQCWPVTVEASERAKVMLKRVRMHIEISGFSQGLKV